VGRLTLVLGLVMAIGPLAIDMYLPALPTLAAEFAVPPARVQHTLSAYLFGMAIGQLVFGPLTDRFGRKTPLIGGLALFGVASAGCALATGMQSLILLRFAQALGGSSGMVVIRAVIRDRFDALQSAQVLSLMMLVMGVAPILAPLLGGWILVHGAWHWIFWLLTIYTVLCVAAVLRYLEESHPPHLRSASIGRAIAGLRRSWSENMSVAFIAGRGGVLRDLLFALRYEADADGADHITIAVPRGHPAADDLSACGYDFVNADDKAGVYGLKL